MYFIILQFVNPNPGEPFTIVLNRGDELPVSGFPNVDSIVITPVGEDVINLSDLYVRACVEPGGYLDK